MSAHPSVKSNFDHQNDLLHIDCNIKAVVASSSFRKLIHSEFQSDFLKCFILHCISILVAHEYQVIRFHRFG